MKVLSVNSGSASLKFKLFEMPEEKLITSGVFERIGEDKSFYIIDGVKKIKNIRNHRDAIITLIDELVKNDSIDNLDEIEAVGHRVVHGGPHFTKSALVNDDVLKEIEKCIPLAPLHNGANLDGINAFMKALPHSKNVVVFDTAFNQSMDEVNYLYAVPYEWYEKYHVRKYGFHGISYNYLTNRLNEILKKKNTRLIICHLGNGASVAAIQNGKVISNSMGFSPSSGLIMGSRAGDFDFTAIPYLIKETGLDLDEIIYKLNYESGLLGISGISNDSRDIEKAIDEGNERAILSRDLYVDSVIGYIAKYYVKMGGVDAICFSAGIGEKSPYARKYILEKLKVLGVKINEHRNNYIGKEVLISRADSSIPVYVLPTNEELMIVRDTYNLIK